MITSAVIEFVVQSMLVIRWRRWLTENFIAHWLGGHAHYRMSLVGSQADNPDQRIAEDVNRFIDGGTDSFGGVGGYGIYTYTIALISTLSSLVAFVVILWTISENFTLPGTSHPRAGISVLGRAGLCRHRHARSRHWIGRPLIGLFFQKQRVEADFRFSLARLREYSEQVAHLSGEPAEQSALDRRFGAIIRQLSGPHAPAQMVAGVHEFLWPDSPDIPYIVAAPFYFAGTIPSAS